MNQIDAAGINSAPDPLWRGYRARGSGALPMRMPGDPTLLTGSPNVVQLPGAYTTRAGLGLRGARRHKGKVIFGGRETIRPAPGRGASPCRRAARGARFGLKHELTRFCLDPPRVDRADR